MPYVIPRYTIHCYEVQPNGRWQWGGKIPFVGNVGVTLWTALYHGRSKRNRTRVQEVN